MLKNTAPRNETVVLVHGIWMHGLFMQVLAWRLRQYGYKTRCVSYPFLSNTPEQNGQVLLNELNTIDTPTVHWAAYSLGGVVLMHCINSGVTMPPGRCVLLGSPVQGSHVAAKIHKARFGQALLGRSVENGLLGGAPLSVAGRTFGLIRGGTYPYNLWVSKKAPPSDGVVLHTETELVGARAVTSVKWSHSCMIFSKTTAKKAAEFFAYGEFSNTG